MAIETDFDVSFVAKLTSQEKQIQQNYRPIIGVHKWFARRPGALFRALLLAEFSDGASLRDSYFKNHDLGGVTICDPFMGGGTTLFEANRIGCNVVGFDINAMAFWIVRQELGPVDAAELREEGERVIADVEADVDSLYETTCNGCGNAASVKYFFWVKQTNCNGCGEDVDLWPGYLVAKNSRHTHFVLHCPGCRCLVQVEELPNAGSSLTCPDCSVVFDWARGTAARNKYSCTCGHHGRYPDELREVGPPRHRLFGLEYHCSRCKPTHKGRFFKTAGEKELLQFEKARTVFATKSLRIPTDEIPDGDETKRLHRWGYRRYQEMFNERQLLSLGVLLERISRVESPETRYALATVFSDFLRYQNMVCRYDVYALKCQDIFAVHGFPVALIQCENNVLGIPRIGSGSFCHFLEKYMRAKAYCETPFETIKEGTGRKQVIEMEGERIAAKFTNRLGEVNSGQRRAFLRAGSICDSEPKEGSFDAILTDPPYFDNVQYAELMDFCYVWLRVLLREDFSQFGKVSTRSMRELTGNVSMGRDLEHFTEGISRVFSSAVAGLRPGGPFVFTYHHNDVEAYIPLVVGILDAGMACTATIPVPAEMTASLHINGTGSSIVDTIVVCRNAVVQPTWRIGERTLERWLVADRKKLEAAGIRCTLGDLSCLAMGHLARVGIGLLAESWNRRWSISRKMESVEDVLAGLGDKCSVDGVLERVLQMKLRDEQLTLLPAGEVV